MDKDTIEDATQMEINISNTDSNSQIVLNDLQLLKLLYSYPFLFSKSVRTHGDKDYEEWGWQEIAKEFNMSYNGLELNTPFTVEELQWRWEVLRPICPSLGKAWGQIPDSLWYIICKINRLMSTKLSVHIKQPSPTQKLILNQLPMIEQLTESQQRRLEVEVLDAILTHERSIHLEALSTKAEDIVQNQYEEFLRAIRVKELPSNSSSGNAFVTSNNNPNMTNIVNTKKGSLIIKEPRSNLCIENAPITSKNNLNTTNIVNSSESNLVISSVCRLLDSREDEQINLPASPPLDIKTEPAYRYEMKQNPIPATGTCSTEMQELRYVPLKSAKYYTKKVVVKLKRFNLNEYMPLSNFKKVSRKSF